MRYYSFEIVIEKEPEDEGYLAYSPQLPGCFSNGRTIEETKINIREAIQQRHELERWHRGQSCWFGEPVELREGWKARERR